MSSDRLTIALHEAPQGFDPHGQTDLASQILHANLLEALVDFEPGGRIVPRAAERWSNPDDSTWLFELAEDVRFSDGRPLRSADVVASLERARSLPGSGVASLLSRVVTISAADSRTVEIVTDGPAPLLLNGLTQVFLVPEDLARSSEISPTEIVGTGRYRLLERDESEILLEEVSGHRDGPPPFPTVLFRVVPNQDDRLEHLLRGDADLTGRLLLATTEELTRHPGTRRVFAPSLQVPLVVVRPDRPPFDDARVRRALDLGLDREAFTGARGGDPHGQLVGPEVFGHDPERPPPRHDAAEARRLLVEAGYTEGLDISLTAGRGLALESLVEPLAEAGIRVSLDPRPFSEVVGGLDSGQVSFAYLSLVASTGDALDTLEALAHSPTRDGRFGSHNWIGLRDPVLDELIEQAGETLVLPKRRRLLHAALAQLAEHDVLLPLGTPFDVYGLRADLEWTPRLDGRILAAEVRPRPSGTRDPA